MHIHPAFIQSGRGLRRLLVASLVLGLLVAVLAARTTPEPAAAERPEEQPDGPTDLSLVYLDTTRADVTTMQIAELDGSNPVRIFHITPRARQLAIRGRLTAGSIGATLTISDLRPSADEYWSTNGRDDVRSAALADDGTAYFSTGFGCRSTPDALPQPSRLFRLEPRSMMTRELVGSVNRVLEVIGLDSATGEVFVVPRGCDVGVDEIQVYSSETGELLRSFPVEGCGRAAVSANGRTAVTAWQACNLPDAHAGAIATIYDLTTGEGRDLAAITNATLRGDLILSPDGGTLTAGGSFGGVAGPLGNSDGALWLVDVATLAVTPLATGLSREAFAVDWSPDGRYLLAGAVEAQGRCTYHIIETATGALRPVNPEITVCGANGRVLGWTDAR